ncbi:hypothetical protein [Ammoniphilus resinae]|uniref:Molybdopterin cofactor biosynthesis MoaD-related C-terminal domain-containing protein n=1 Tax=Ammoniphilus resinae TaxID=861532 RepID=A0ABS4GR26_9BACL|nr:hypothetical protein [Ammoniphilus resinae]MBP1932728.1 hypothetical protein [Ammoniphilus resinae]
MAEKVLEFRGIPLAQLVEYFLELGGTRLTSSLPISIQNDRWQVELTSEKMVSITSTFQVNAVFVRFLAPNEEALAEIIARYRKKTLRVGG